MNTSNSHSYIYHRAVENMEGTILYPLNTLKTLFPLAYEAHVKKYVGREQLLTARIPMLDCLWNDVIHFTAVHPSILKANLELAGYNTEEIVWKRWYAIPVSLLDEKNAVACLYRRDMGLTPEAKDFQAFNPNMMKEYATVPPETIAYYREKKAQGLRPLLFNRVPHILYKGTIDISKCEVIEM